MKVSPLQWQNGQKVMHVLTDVQAAEEMKLLVEIIRSVRNSRAEVNTPMSKKIKMIVKAKDQAVLAILKKTELIWNDSVIQKNFN